MDLQKICKNCHKSFSKLPLYSYKQWDKRIFCSNKCVQKYAAIGKRIDIKCLICGKIKNLTLTQYNHGGKTCSKECRYKYVSKYKRGENHHCFGKKLSPDHIKKLSLSHIGKPNFKIRGEKSHWWKGGNTKRNHRERNRTMATLEYKNFRRFVLNRDKNKCSICGGINKLEIHHIKPFELYPNLIFDPDNGQTLCVSCHYVAHNKKPPNKTLTP